MIPTIFNLERRLQFKKRHRADFLHYDFLHREVFLSHLESLSVILQEMKNITFIDVPNYFLDFSETHAFLTLKKTVNIQNIIRESEVFPPNIIAQDAIIALFTCHTVNDLIGYFIQIKNALKPNGVFIASFVGDKTINILRNAVMNAELNIIGACDNRFHPVIDIRTLGGILQRAGFTIPVVDSQDYTLHYTDLKKIFTDIRKAGESNCLVNFPKPLRRDVYNEAIKNLDNAVKNHIFSVDILTITGNSPCETQQKPLKPGSAQISLKNALYNHDKID